MSFENSIAFESFGVKIRITTKDSEILKLIKKRLQKIIPEGLSKMISPQKAVYNFSIKPTKDFAYVLYKGRNKITFSDDLELLLKYFDFLIRVTIAEFAVQKVFLHAGVVSWNGKAIIFPARSFQGKTTLVKMLTKLGAIYYSDDYAVLDETGFVHPFPKELSIRGLKDSAYEQVEFPVETFGGKKGVDPVPVGMIVLTEYEQGAEWNPQILSEGKGILEMLSHTISIRYNPKFSLKVLNKTVNRAIIVKTKRGEAEPFAKKMLRFFEKNAN